MKYTFPLLIVLFSAKLLMAQEFKVQAANTKESKLTLLDFLGDLPIEGYNGNEIIITSTSGHFEAPERAKGLKPVYGGGNDNTGIGIYLEKNGNSITLRCLVPLTQSASYKLRVPENIALEIERDCARGGETTIQHIRNEVEFKGCHDINLKNVTGPLVISTISGSVSVTFSEISKDKPISIASVSGEVDVTIPANAAVDLEMGTVSGNMYSDFDFPSNSKDMRRVGGGKIRSQLNGGGTNLRLNNISGNIYLRKG